MKWLHVDRWYFKHYPDNQQHEVEPGKDGCARYAGAAERQGSRVTFKRLESDTDTRLSGHGSMDRGMSAADSEADGPISPPRNRKERVQLRKVFDAWREYTVRKSTGHTGRKWQNNEGGETLPPLYHILRFDCVSFCQRLNHLLLLGTIIEQSGDCHPSDRIFQTVRVVPVACNIFKD